MDALAAAFSQVAFGPTGAAPVGAAGGAPLAFVPGAAAALSPSLPAAQTPAGPAAPFAAQPLLLAIAQPLAPLALPVAAGPEFGALIPAAAAVDAAATSIVPAPGSTKSMLYKTELCRSFSLMSECSYGSKCQYAHGPHELRSRVRTPKYKTQKCRNFWELGSCQYGARCNFIHLESRPPDATVVSSGSESLSQHQAIGASLLKHRLRMQAGTAGDADSDRVGAIGAGGALDIDGEAMAVAAAAAQVAAAVAKIDMGAGFGGISSSAELSPAPAALDVALPPVDGGAGLLVFGGGSGSSRSILSAAANVEPFSRRSSSRSIVSAAAGVPSLASAHALGSSAHSISTLDGADPFSRTSSARTIVPSLADAHALGGSDKSVSSVLSVLARPIVS